jgi:WXXGXW repeat (2 copies)
MRNLIRALIATLSLTAVPVISQAGLVVGVSVGIPPPALPVYVQPPCPAPGYIWMPGYWAWDDGYYWVPGTWVVAPAVGLLWTPGYWGWENGAYLWHAGYWGPHVGFYGGINYGFGYSGVGYEGGYWHGHEFYYNRAVTNINSTHITNVYSRTVINDVNVTHVSFNGGAGGVAARPTAAQLSAEHERHLGLTPVQRQQQQLARANSSLRAAVNNGHPGIAATPRAGEFSGHGVSAARGAEHGTEPLAARGAEHTSGAAHPGEERSPARVSTPVEPRAPAHPPQYAARTPEHQSGTGSGYPARTYQPRGEQQSEARPAAPPPPRPAPQYQPHSQPQYQARPEPQHQSRPEPQHQTRPAPQSPGHTPQQAARPEHGAEHGNRQS